MTKSKRILSILLSLVMLFAAAPTVGSTVFAANPGNSSETECFLQEKDIPITAEVGDNYYRDIQTTGFSGMRILKASQTIYYGFSKLENDRLRQAYNTICDSVSRRETSISLSEYNLTQDDLKKVMELYRFDHPEHYWLPNEYAISLLGDKVTALKLTYLTGFDTAAFDTAAAALLARAKGESTDYGKALALHDALVKHVTYNTVAVNAHNAYGAIVGKQAVCEGYAEAYQYLLQQVGIQSYIVTGESHGEGHEWNLVCLDGKYYYTDVTWDDPVSSSESDKPIFYSYFNITTARLEEDHFITDTYGLLPVCTDESMMYTGLTKLETYTVDSVAAAFKDAGSQKIARIYRTGSQDFGVWWAGNFHAVAQKIGVINARMNNCGREYYIVCQAASIPATNITLNNTTLTLKEGGTATLIASVTPQNSTDMVKWTSSDSRIASVDASGKVTALKKGTVTIIATAGTKSVACTVTVTCAHSGKTNHPAQNSSCTKQGWDEYYSCDSCGQLFAGDGTTEIDAIVYRALAEHPWTTDYKAENADSNKHYHLCTACGEKDGGQTHIWNIAAATEKTDKYCTVCGYVAQARLEKPTYIRISRLPNKLSYIVGQQLDTAGLELELTYNNGTTRTVSGGWESISYDFSKPGQQTVQITYGGKTATFTATVTAETVITKGNINDDDIINIKDALLALQHSVGLKKLEGSQLVAGDVNEDGIVSVTDALQILQYSVGLRTEFTKTV